MRSSYDEGANYFEILVNVFSSEIRSTKNDHLRHFFLIVPSLTIAYVDSMLVAKDKLQKKAREAYFTDDGFAMGLAYLLKLLEQNEQFETLYWWDTVQARYAAERTALQEAAGAASTGGRKEDANTLALKRIRSYELEYELLECAFCSARIFFRT
jgi:WASH complex subunit 7